MKRDVLLTTLACTLALAMGCAKGGRGGAGDVGAGNDRAEPGQRSRGIVLLDSGGRRIRELQSGSSLEVAATGLAPRTLYEFRLAVGGEPARSAGESVSFARASSDAAGRVHPFVLWYQSGVVGCSLRTPRDAQLPPFTWRTFEEAQERLAGQTLTVSAHPIAAGAAADRESLTRVPVGPAASVARLPLRARRHPLVYPSAKDGCLLNAIESGTDDLYVSGRNFAPNEVLEVAIVPNQRGWRVGDAIDDVSGTNGTAGIERVTADAEGRFTVRAWERAQHRRGAYDIIVRRRPTDGEVGRRLGPGDVASYGSDTAVLLFLRYPPGGPTMDIAGRPLTGSPYFQFADSFADAGDTVWGAVDPTYVPLTHPGGRYAAYYVVNHRDVAGWDPLSGGSTALADVSGGIEIMPVKAGCINATDVPIWHPPLPTGNYDVVVDFGVTPAETQVAYATDSQYDSALDFLDGADQVGFVVAPDPHALGTVPIGRTTYSFDDLFPTMGTATNVDLRAVVRYPATAAGDDTPVAPGRHPIFLIQHGNHRICESGAHFCDRPGCTDRTVNHMGYMRLLDVLASHGIIAVSIDAYDLTGPHACTSGWINERGDLILRHLEFWSHADDATTFTTYTDPFAGRFTGHLDLTKISVSGHSRGGEASVAAFMRNTAFTIGSVSSIAPVDFMGFTLPDVPYFVILPAADGDVSDMSGAHIYDRAGSGTSPTPAATTKSGIYVYGASHNLFNTVWAGHGDDGASPRPDQITAADQQRLGEAYLAAFARIHLKGQTVYEDMLRGRLIFPSTAGRKIYHSRHEKSHRKLDNGTGSGTPGGGLVTSSVVNPSVHRTTVRRFQWNAGTAEFAYAVPVGQRDVTPFEVLSFRVAQTNSTLNPASGGQEFQVELVGGGNVRAVYASRFDQIPKPYNHPGLGTDHNVMTTVRIPLHSFIMNRSGVTLNDIDTVRFRFTFPTQGEVHVDDVEFSR